MKTFLLLAISCSIALTQGVKAEDQHKVKDAKNRSRVTQTPRGVTGAGPRVTGAGPHINQKTVHPYQYHPKVQPTARVRTNPIIRNTYVPRSPTVQADTRVSNKNWQHNNWQKNKNPSSTLPNKNWQNNNYQRNAQKNNWQNNNNSSSQNWQKKNWHNSNSWTEARRRHPRDHHDRNWWRSHYSRFALFGTGYYFWDSGYWYPAYGYDSGYNTYSYDEPIYGYNDLDPAQVISNVQTELQRLGYYRYAVDGTMGPATRAAISNYQRDRGLSITAAIDGPTLDSLGLG
jgi:Putative peptidoglycan binding domain